MNVTNSLIVLCFIFFGFQMILGYEFTEVGLLVGGLLLTEPWRIFTSMFLHADFMHLFFNMFALFIFGNALERRIGSGLLLLIYLVSGVVGGMGFMVLTGPDTAALGASGAIFGVIGAMVMIAPRMPVYLWGAVPLPMAVVGLGYALIEILAFGSVDGIAHSAHLLGFIGGFAIALTYKNVDTQLSSQINVTKALVISFIFGLVVAFGFGFYFAS